MLVVKALKRIHCKAEKPKGMNYETHRIVSGCPCKARLGVCLEREDLHNWPFTNPRGYSPHWETNVLLKSKNDLRMPSCRCEEGKHEKI